jgi:hypothetical protein
MAQFAYAACGRTADAARVEQEYLQLGAEARARVPDYALYLRLWQRGAGRREDGSWPTRACDEWGRDSAERQLEAAIAFFRGQVHPETAQRSEVRMRVLTPAEARLSDLRAPVEEADLFARGAVARAMAEDMRCGRTAEAEAVETRLLAIERSVPDALYVARTLAQFKYDAGQSRDGSWPRPPGHQCLAEDRRDLDGDVEQFLGELEAAARAYVAAPH